MSFLFPDAADDYFDPKPGAAVEDAKVIYGLFYPDESGKEIRVGIKNGKVGDATTVVEAVRLVLGIRPVRQFEKRVGGNLELLIEKVTVKVPPPGITVPLPADPQAEFTYSLVEAMDDNRLLWIDLRPLILQLLPRQTRLIQVCVCLHQQELMYRLNQNQFMP